MVEPVKCGPESGQRQRAARTQGEKSIDASLKHNRMVARHCEGQAGQEGTGGLVVLVVYFAHAIPRASERASVAGRGMLGREAGQATMEVYRDNDKAMPSRVISRPLCCGCDLLRRWAESDMRDLPSRICAQWGMGWLRPPNWFSRRNVR